MPYINGLSESTKLALVEYCYRHRITQKDWVNKHLEADLQAEAGQASNEEESK